MFSDISFTRLVWVAMIGDFQRRETSRLSPGFPGFIRGRFFLRQNFQRVQAGRRKKLGKSVWIGMVYNSGP